MNMGVNSLRKMMVRVPKCLIAPSVLNKGIRGHEFSELRDGLLCRGVKGSGLKRRHKYSEWLHCYCGD